MAEKITKNLLQANKEKQSLKKELHDQKMENELLNGTIAALQTELQIQKDLYNKIKRGGMFYWTSNGFVTKINTIEGYFETTYPQEEIDNFNINDVIGIMNTTRYIENPFVYVENGTFKIDIDKYKKYRGGL